MNLASTTFLVKNYRESVAPVVEHANKRVEWRHRQLGNRRVLAGPQARLWREAKDNNSWQKGRAGGALFSRSASLAERSWSFRSHLSLTGVKEKGTM